MAVKEFLKRQLVAPELDPAVAVDFVLEALQDLENRDEERCATLAGELRLRIDFLTDFLSLLEEYDEKACSVLAGEIWSQIDPELRKLHGVTFVPESQVSYHKDRGIEAYQLPSLFAERGIEKGVILSDSVELLEAHWEKLPFTKLSSSVVVLKVEFPRNMLLAARKMKNTQTGGFAHLWAVSEVKPHEIEGVEGVLFGPPSLQ